MAFASRFKPPSRGEVGENVTILMVDDDEVDVMGLERAFRRGNMHNPIVTAPDGIAALALLRDGHSVMRPYMIVLDINMPRMTGIEFLDEVRGDKKLQDSVVFVLTTSKDDEDKHRAYPAERRRLSGQAAVE